MTAIAAPRPPSEHKPLRMKVAGAVVNHLGLHNYAGAVPAISELVANGWDADAKRVDIEIPLGKAWSDEDIIAITDKGTGMAYEECQDKYLVLGRDKRKIEGEFSGGGRRIMGRKGIGKLAGFGIARRVEVRTVKDGHVVHFALNYDDIVLDGTFNLQDYEPEVLADEEVEEPAGTSVILKRIVLKRAVPVDQFKMSMARRFAVLGDNFQVFVNGEPVVRGQMPLQYRLPEKGLKVESVEGFGDVSWWMGFTRKPIPDEEARGIVVFARGKLAQAPWFFDMTGGAHGQHGMQYMVGEVYADGLDAEVDLVATGRQTVLWEHPKAEALKMWGVKLIKRGLNEWADRRSAVKLERLSASPYQEFARTLHPPDRELFEKTVSALSKVDSLEEETFVSVVGYLVSSFSNERFFKTVRALVERINEHDPKVQAAIYELFAEWGVLEALNWAPILRGRVEIIRTFGAKIDAGAPEFPDMQELVEKYPWLLDLTWQNLRRNQSLERIIREELGLPKEGGPTMPDFFCLSDEPLRHAEVIELKRPGEPAGKKELYQLKDYVFAARKASAKVSDPESKWTANGLLVAGRFADGLEQDIVMLSGQGIFTRPWKQQLSRVEAAYRKELELVKESAPADDPRIRMLDIGDKPDPTAALPARSTSS